MPAFKIGKMVMRSLFKKPATLMYPVIPREWQERTRGHIENEIDSCIFCGICQKKCPTNALVVDRAKKSWTIERMQCIQCSCCVEVCPKKCLTNENTYTTPSTEKVVDTYVASPTEPKAEVPKAPAAPKAAEAPKAPETPEAPKEEAVKQEEAKAE
ncbi:4Fe-4S dicluster domain-containing protein [Sinanaerobacter chloroacetimidivorans]|uniref:4Fe-4S dicluster domain-containing protein n=1 Tax=Sinanaerobacter chloroacetimidivorans TaxID=2818044 RepID=A0A8J8B0X1_9FIRM|nr:4Fe-4S dicluster domain-containing protein [Sinanaerobacter chloroacetimidivorans]MBR0597609.1 4Fe-4S dicluster domain-containing protein [Sinanaerobacter chloroacetimidivorans]